MTDLKPATTTPDGQGEQPIRMSLHFEDADPVSTCLVGDCRWHAHGDSMNDAVTAWAHHLTVAHRSDWGDQ